MAVRLPLPITTPRPPFCRPHPSSRFFPICRASSSSATNTATTCTLKLTYLEINTWVWELHQDHHPKVRILVDPILVGDLDFGAPWLFNGAKKNPWMKALGVDKAMEPPPDLLLITQSLDDHCHVRTRKQLSALARRPARRHHPQRAPRPRLSAHALPPRHLPRARPVHGRRRRPHPDTGRRGSAPRTATSLLLPTPPPASSTTSRIACTAAHSWKAGGCEHRWWSRPSSSSSSLPTSPSSPARRTPSTSPGCCRPGTWFP
jgi:cellulase/cellobiase CelA1